MAKVSAKYEVVYIVNPTKSEEETAALVAKFTALAEQHASASDVAWAASFSKTRGSSSVRSDFSNNSSIPFDPSQRI